MKIERNDTVRSLRVGDVYIDMTDSQIMMIVSLNTNIGLDGDDRSERIHVVDLETGSVSYWGEDVDTLTYMPRAKLVFD